MDPSGVPLDAPSPGGPSRKKAEVDYKFCLLCSNLLYPKEDRMTNTLNYICKACHQVQPAEASCTYRNQLGSTVTETAGVTTDVANDPTLPRSTQRCPKCRNTDAVHFQSQQRTNETGMKLYYVCLECNHVYTIV